MLHFDEASHTYTLDGKVVPSVTQIIRPLEAEALASIPAGVLEWKRGLGHAVHLACQLDDEGDLDAFSIDDRILPYLMAWRAFRLDYGFKVTMNEQALGSRKYRFAGTVDRLGVLTKPIGLKRNYTGPAIVDLKTRVTLPDAIGVQLAGYAKLVAEQGLTGPDMPPLRLAVRLCDDGQYSFRIYDDPEDHACFQACLVQHHWMEKHK